METVKQSVIWEQISLSINKYEILEAWIIHLGFVICTTIISTAGVINININKQSIYNKAQTLQAAPSALKAGSHFIGVC